MTIRLGVLVVLLHSEWLNAFYILRWMSWQILLTAYTQPHLKSSPAWSKEVKVAGHVFYFLFLDINHLQVQRDTKDKLKYDCCKYREKCMYSLCVCDNKTVLQLSRGSVILTTNETGDLISRCLPVWLMSSWCDGEQNMKTELPPVSSPLNDGSWWSQMKRLCNGFPSSLTHQMKRRASQWAGVR